MNAFLSMTRANLKMTLRDRTRLFWLLLFPALFILIFGSIANGSRYLDYLVPGILAMSIMQGGVVGLSGAFVVMRERGILRRVRATPFPLTSFIGSRVATQLLVAVLQSAILLALARLVFGLRVDARSMPALALFVVLGSLAFLAVGFFIAGVSGRQEGAVALAQLVSFPMLFLSGVFFPLDQSPVWLQDLAKALPLSYLADGLRQVMVHGAPLWSERWDVLALLVTAAVGLLLAVRFFRWEPRTT